MVDQITIQPIQDDSAELKHIGQVVQHDNRLMVLPFNAKEAIQFLRLNTKKKHRGVKH